ncbi:MAG TPA: hypothetical protein VFB12_14175 [Ktedonobacteraceae bacterium]|nr:hypothetical protein [Ktedonobacteraceae bacterium]
MTYVLLTLASIIAYIAGLMVIARVTPKLLSHAFDEGLFMGIAALIILGSLLVFGAVVMTYAVFNAALAVKILDFLFLVGIFIVAIRVSLFSFRSSALPGTYRISRILAGSYCLLLAVAAICYIVQLFVV